MTPTSLDHLVPSASIDRKLWETFVKGYVVVENGILVEEDDDWVKALPKMFVVE